MASEDIPFTAAPAEAPIEFSANSDAVGDLASFQSANLALGNRNTFGDAGIGILDTLQSLGTLALAPLPGYELQDAASNSQFLDQFRSPAYLATRDLLSLNNDPNAGFIDGALDAGEDILTGGNIIADATAQLPYLAMGPAARLAGVARAEKIAGVLGKVARLTAGTNETAVVNRLAAISGLVEGGSAYGQTYQRALDQTGDASIAEDQALKAAAVSTVLGAVLGRATPAFELHPTGTRLSSVASHLSAIGGEAIVEEGGLAIGQTVTDNILAGKDPMDSVGESFGQAVAISGAFSGALRAPGTVLAVSKDIGQGVLNGIDALADRAVTPERAAVDAAEKATQEQTPASQPSPEPTPVQATEETPAPTEVKTATTVEQPVVESESDQLSPYFPNPRPFVPNTKQESDTPSQTEQSVPKEVTSRSATIRAVLVDANNDALIENTTGEEQAAALARKEEFAPTVKKAQEVIQNLSAERVETIATLAEEGNQEAQQAVEAIQRTDISKLPEKSVPKFLRPIAQKIKEVKELGLDKTTNEILEDGFNSASDSRGIAGYLQGLVNLNTIGVQRPNQTSAELERFVTHLQNRAQAFQAALNDPGIHVPVTGTKTRTAKGGLTDKPFIIHKTNKNSMATVQRVFDDAKRAQEALDVARKSFPGMFPEQQAVVPVATQPVPTVPVATQSDSIDLIDDEVPLPNLNADEPTDAQQPEQTPAVKVASTTGEKPSPVGKTTLYRGVPNGIDADAPTKTGLLFYADTKKDAAEYAGEGSEVLEKPADLTPENTDTFYNRAQFLAENGLDQNAPGGLDPSALYAAARNYFAKPGAKPWIQFAYPELDGQREFIHKPSLETSTVEVATATPPDSLNASVIENREDQFAQFNGVNRFTESFNPTGSGLLTTRYSGLIEALNNGSEDDKRAAEHLNKVVPNLIEALNNYVQKVLNSPVSKNDKTLLKDALRNNQPFSDYTNYVWVHLLSKTATGYELNPAVVEAAAVSAVMQLTRGAFQRSTNEVSETTDGLYYQWLNNVGQDSMRILGTTADQNASLTLTDGIPKALAATVLQVLADEGDITINTLKTSDNLTLKNIVMNENTATFFRSFPAFPEVMRKFIGDAEDDTIHYGSPPTAINERYRNSRTKISDTQRTALENRQKVAHYRNLNFMNVLNALGDTYTKLVTGFAEVSDDKQLNEVSSSLVIGMRGELNAVTQYNAGLELHAKEAGVDANGVPVYFSYEILRNGRSFSGYSPQTKKTLREFLSVSKQTLDLTNPTQKRMLQIAIAQSLGIKTDVNTHDEIIAKLNQMIPSVTDKALALHLVSQGETVPELAQLMDRDGLYEPKEIHGLMILGKMLVDPNNKAFENTLTFEIDGKTNGPFMAELLFGLHSLDKQSQKNLEQGGFFFGVEGETLATMRDSLREKYGSGDLYERVAKNTTALHSPILALAGFTSENGDVTRSAAKEAVTPLVYGSGINSLGAVFAARINNGLTERLRLAIKHNDTKLAAQLRGYIGSSDIVELGEQLAEELGNSYSTEKPQVTYTNQLMVAATALHAGVRKALFERQVAERLKQKRANGELPKQYDLSRADYNKILRSLPNTEVTIPGMGTVAVGESANTGRSTTRVEGAGKVNSVQISMPEIENPGVSILALSTIAGGDASMGNTLFQNQEQVLDVYDGIEIPVTEIDQIGQKLNAVVWSSASDSIVDSYAPLLDWVIENETELNNEELSKTLSRLRKRFGVSTNVEAVKSLKNELAHISEKIKAGRARISAKPSSLNQMSGAATAFTTPGNDTVRTEPATRTVRDGWNTKIEAGFDAANGVLNREGVTALLDGHKWTNPIHRAVWGKLRSILPETLNVSLAKDEAAWNQLNEVGDNGYTYGSVKGLSFSDSGKILLASTDPTTLLHELIHQVISGNITQYFSNINAVSVELRQPINDLTQLLKRFLAIKSNDATLASAQGFIRNLKAKGDMAGAVDEMIAHVLTNEDVINAVMPSLFQRVVLRVKQILSSLFGKQPDSFVNEVLAAFNSLAAGPRIEVSSGIRTSPLHDATAAVFAIIGQKVANGQISNKVPKVKDSGLDKVTGTYNLDVEQKRIYNRVWMLLRMDNRSGIVEQFASTVLNHHPNASVFNGTLDAVASVMALAAVDDTFRAQADAIWAKHSNQPNTVAGVVDSALNKAAITDANSILLNAFDVMRQEGEYNLSFLGTATKRLDRMGNEWLERIGEKAYQIAQTAPKGIAELAQAIHALTTEDGAEAFAKATTTMTNLTDARWAQDLVAALVGSQKDTNEVYRQLSAMKSGVAQTRSLFTITLPGQLKKLFPEGFDGWSHLFKHFGRIDAGVLGSSAAEMFSDDAARAKNIKALESRVNALDAKNLAHYMVHGTTMKNNPRPLLRNARAIADELNDTPRIATDTQVADADQLVTLYAIDMLAKVDRARIAGYFTTHPEAMNNLVGMLQKVNAEEMKQYQDTHRYLYWKGALPLSTDPRMSIVIAGAVKGAELEALGYKRVKKYQSSHNDPANDMYYYTRDNAPPPTFTQGVIATVQQTAMGINYVTSASISPEVGTMITSPRLVEYIKNNTAAGSNLVPMFNYQGEIVGYERLLDRKFVLEQTHSDNTMLHIAIGHKLGRITEENMAKRFNQEAIGILVRQWEEGKKNGDESQYEAVNQSKDRQIERAWEIVPADMKKALEEAFGGKVMIRKDLISNTLGYHQAGVGDIITGNASIGEQTRLALFGLAQAVMGPQAAQVLFTAESAIKEGVATAKDWIIVRSLSVALSNAMASLNLVVANGVPLKEIFNSYREGIRDIRDYSRLNKEIIELTIKIAGVNGREKDRLRTIQRGKYEAIRRLAIYPLIEAGELSDLPEGLEETPSHSFAGDFAGWLNNHLRKIHPKTPDIVANAIIAKDTAVHDAISKAIQAGDFLGKWAVYKHMVRSGKSPEVARDTIREEFIAYSTNPGRFRGALEDFGVVWWSQFTLRAQKVMLRRLRKNPFSFFVSTLASNLGTDGPADAVIWERGWDNSTGLDNVPNAASAHIWSKIF
jgi:hypothetical protein